MELTFRELTNQDIEAMWRINEEGLPGVGQVSREELAALRACCESATGAFHAGSLAGFVLCLLPQQRYGSPNYGWFNERYSEFLYVDRIAVGVERRGQGVGTALYKGVTAAADQLGWPVAAEVSSEPPNPGSMRFHRRFGFKTVGEVAHTKQTVAMVLRAPEALT